MAYFIQPSDFDAGVFRLAQDQYTEDDLQTYIDKYEKHYLRRILGDQLYTNLIADLNTTPFPNVPLSAKYLALVNGSTYTNDAGKFVIYEGLIEAVKYFIWVEFVRRSNYINTIAGTVQNLSENSTSLTRGLIAQLCRDAWNTGTPLARGTNYFIFNFDNYKVTSTSIVLSSGTTYLVSLTDTLYLVNSDTVTINGADYTVANLIANTSFEITSASNIANTGVTVEWDVFGTYEETPIDYSYLNA